VPLLALVVGLVVPAGRCCWSPAAGRCCGSPAAGRLLLAAAAGRLLLVACCWSRCWRRCWPRCRRGGGRSPASPPFDSVLAPDNDVRRAATGRPPGDHRPSGCRPPTSPLPPPPRTARILPTRPRVHTSRPQPDQPRSMERIRPKDALYRPHLAPPGQPAAKRGPTRTARPAPTPTRPAALTGSAALTGPGRALRARPRSPGQRRSASQPRSPGQPRSPCRPCRPGRPADRHTPARWQPATGRAGSPGRAAVSTRRGHDRASREVWSTAGPQTRSNVHTWRDQANPSRSVDQTRPASSIQHPATPANQAATRTLLRPGCRGDDRRLPRSGWRQSRPVITVPSGQGRRERVATRRGRGERPLRVMACWLGTAPYRQSWCKRAV
jgi:hypothetical protein